MWKHAVYAFAAVALAAFFAFVGWHKAFSSMADLARHGAYTAHLPEWIGRVAGWMEMAGAVALVAGIYPGWRARLVPPAALFFILSQIASSIIHVQHDEAHMLPQNALIAGTAALLWWIARNSRTSPQN
jgi:DoxX-like family